MHMGGCATAPEALPWTAKVEPVWIAPSSIDCVQAYDLTASCLVSAVSAWSLCLVICNVMLGSHPPCASSVAHRLAVSLVECCCLDGQTVLRVQDS